MNTFLICLSSLLICFTLLPLIKNDYWIFRIFDYPRLQKLTLSCLCLILLVVFFDNHDTVLQVCTAAVSINVIYLFVLVMPFTPAGKKQVLRVQDNKPEQSLSLMIANVYQDNDRYKECLDEIYKCDPDIVFLLETGKRWEAEMAELADKYPYSVLKPLDNTYGMLLYSRLQLDDTSIKFLVENDVPSIHTKVLLNDGTAVQLYGLHPTPPVPNENLRSTERDKELLLVADMATETNLPVIVIGDLNDVAWSYTTELFLKMSGLLDPRRGRGFFNSFHARYPFLRFPLDHAFISPHFKLKELKRLNNFGSDHFPIFISLQYDAIAVSQQEPMQPDKADVKEAAEKKAKI